MAAENRAPGQTSNEAGAVRKETQVGTEPRRKRKGLEQQEQEGQRASLLKSLEHSLKVKKEVAVLKTALKLPPKTRQRLYSEQTCQQLKAVDQLIQRFPKETPKKRQEEMLEYILDLTARGNLDAYLLERVFQRIEILDQEKAKDLLAQKYGEANYVAATQREAGENRLLLFEKFFSDISRFDRLRLLGHETMHILSDTVPSEREEVLKSFKDENGQPLLFGDLETYYIRELLSANKLTGEDLLEEIVAERFADFVTIPKGLLPKLNYEEWKSKQTQTQNEEELRRSYEEYLEERAGRGAAHMLACRLLSIGSEPGGIEKLKALLGEETFSALDPPNFDLFKVDLKKISSALQKNLELSSKIKTEYERDKKLFKFFESVLAKAKEREFFTLSVQTTPLPAEEPSTFYDPLPYFGETQTKETSNLPSWEPKEMQALTTLSSGIAEFVADIIKGQGAKIEIKNTEKKTSPEGSRIARGGEANSNEIPSQPSKPSEDPPHNNPQNQNPNPNAGPETAPLPPEVAQVSAERKNIIGQINQNVSTVLEVTKGRSDEESIKQFIAEINGKLKNKNIESLRTVLKVSQEFSEIAERQQERGNMVQSFISSIKQWGKESIADIRDLGKSFGEVFTNKEKFKTFLKKSFLWGGALSGAYLISPILCPYVALALGGKSLYSYYENSQKETLEREEAFSILKLKQGDFLRQLVDGLGGMVRSGYLPIFQQDERGAIYLSDFVLKGKETKNTVNKEEAKRVIVTTLEKLYGRKVKSDPDAYSRYLELMAETKIPENEAKLNQNLQELQRLQGEGKGSSREANQLRREATPLLQEVQEFYNNTYGSMASNLEYYLYSVVGYGSNAEEERSIISIYSAIIKHEEEKNRRLNRFRELSKTFPPPRTELGLSGISGLLGGIIDIE